MPCKNCLADDPTAFYETQSSNYCKPCHKQKYFNTGRQRVIDAKLQRGHCVDCRLAVTPETTFVFEWDHLRDKHYNVSSMVTMCDAKFYAEIEKCELRCANCHRIATHSRPRVHSGGRPRKVQPHETMKSEPAPYV